MPSSKNIIAHVTADLAKGTVNVQQVNCVQYDAETKVIAVHLRSGGEPWEIPSGYAVNVRMHKVDGTVVYNPGEAEDDIAYITLSGQMCVLPGEQTFVVELVSGDNVAQTAPIFLHVIRNPMQEGDEISEDEKETIQGLVEQAQAAAEESQKNADEAYNWNQNCITLYHQTEDQATAAQTAAEKAQSILHQILSKDAKLEAVAQSDYDALDPPDPKTLYVVLEDGPETALQAYYPLTSDVADMLSGQTGSVVGDGGFADGGLRTAPAGASTQQANYVQLPEGLFAGLGITSTSGLTIALDVMPDTTCTAGNGDWVRLINCYKPSGTPTDTAEGELYLTQGCIATAFYDSVSTQVVDASKASAITAGSWHTVALVVNSYATSVAVYVDGVLQAQASGSTNNILGQIEYFAQNYIGRSRFSDNDFVGVVRNLRVYNRSLTSTEIGQIGRTPSWSLYYDGTQLDSGAGTYLPLAGGTMTGNIVLAASDDDSSVTYELRSPHTTYPAKIRFTTSNSYPRVTISGGMGGSVTVGGGGAVEISGSLVRLQASGGSLSANSCRIQDVSDPTADTDATNKQYVDNALDNATRGLASEEYVTSAIDSAIAGTANAPRYGVQFSGSANTGTTVTRLYDAAGLTAAVGTDTATATNDFDNLAPWSNRRRCCGYWSDAGQFVVNAYEGEPGYATDGSNGEVWIEQSLWYYRHTVSEDGVEEVAISTYPYSGYSPAPIFLSQGGQAQPYQKAYTAAYPMATVDGKPTSRSGVFPGTYSLNTAMTAARALGDSYCTTTAGEWYSDWLLMVVEFATRNLQTVMVGATQLPWDTSHVALLAEESVNRIVITASQASNYVVGQTIGIGTSQGGNQVCSNRRITSIEEVDGGTALYFDGDPVTIAEGNQVYTLAWITGTCDNVQSSSGSYISNTSGKYQCIYRGKEKPYGDCYEWCCDVMFQRNGSGTEDDPYTYTAHYLPDPTAYNSGSITEDYVQLGYEVPTADGYSTELGLDERFPWVRVPSSVGGSSTTYYADYYQYPRSAVTAGRLGGYWFSGGGAGPACWNCSNAPSASWVYYRARLSFHRT